MKVYLGIDLGSTTSKAVLIDERDRIIGRGITNTRANYEVAAEIARMEAEFNSRFTLLHRRLERHHGNGTDWNPILKVLRQGFRYLQFRERFHRLWSTMLHQAESQQASPRRAAILEFLHTAADPLLEDIRTGFFGDQVNPSAEFFREIFSSRYLDHLQRVKPELFDPLLAIYDCSITPVENQVIEFDFIQLMDEALTALPEEWEAYLPLIRTQLEAVARVDLTPSDYIGTGYGRQLLPFEEKHIKSEILCHAFGAHAVFPRTRTVLDIGGQDTKAIQVDAHGLVTSFQMNDRCAAGCGRYLGYIADEMNVSVSELGPIALEAEYEANICSTCTVFAGAELREYLNLGEKKENILAGLHQAIVQRAFALLARSGGVRNEFTFTGGVARNEAVVKYVRRLILDHYGQLTINIHPDSIFMGALGAALFSARR
jgi:benzoyl-CoA reductase subunit A